MNKILISINSIEDNNGGGMYLISLIKQLPDIQFVICKQTKNPYSELSNKKIYFLNKNLITDFISRILLFPTYVGFYSFFLIIKSMKMEEVYLHNTRLLPLGLLLKIIGKKVYIIHDNHESALVFQQWRLNKFNLVRLFDFFLLIVYEKFFVSIFSESIVIEKNLINTYGLKNSRILPYKHLKSNWKPNKLDYKSNIKKILFVGSFDFEPNKEALLELDELSINFKDIRITAAGRKETLLLDEKKISNIQTIFNPSRKELNNLFYDSDIFLSLLKHGSGQKIKIAEALSHNMWIIATTCSLNGFEHGIIPTVFEIDDNYRKKDIIYIIKSINQFSNSKKEILKNKSWDIIKEKYLIK